MSCSATSSSGPQKSSRVPTVSLRRTLELLAVPVGGSERWKVEFDVRAQAEEA